MEQTRSNMVFGTQGHIIPKWIVQSGQNFELIRDSLRLSILVAGKFNVDPICLKN